MIVSIRSAQSRRPSRSGSLPEQQRRGEVRPLKRRQTLPRRPAADGASTVDQNHVMSCACSPSFATSAAILLNGSGGRNSPKENSSHVSDQDPTEDAVSTRARRPCPVHARGCGRDTITHFHFRAARTR